ncbi:uncharacterized protein NECHADRAFT_87299 [Fusarium vanettenii 77-13-4]|uniref:Uncharacterized protein n=1 Tax=Fusarium vanettenii (strain ATCC MYA-4622 / CBS 123669 / FGSC 9596 / NRRL 45880 / 77-13-4) TaxID=660122 RepID=C7ZLE7_FUSV7|nr:uncharacterized protein NECHADRAFT_87299 [Fusarium vanettenii 77-13-4]EEU35149.1 predicted protein [Fusarium vanettenii 77-13-4]
MAEQRPPTPATGDDSLSVGPSRKAPDAEECTLVSFYAETYPGGPLLLHNLWFHESWSGFDAPLNILFGEIDYKPMAVMLPHAPEGTPKNDYDFEFVQFHGPRPDKSEREPPRPNSRAGNQHANARVPPFFRASAERVRGMANRIRIPTFRPPPARWWYHKFKQFLKAVLILVTIIAVIFAGFKLVDHGPQLRENIVSKFESITESITQLITQGSSHTDHFNADRDDSDNRDYFNMGRDYFDTDKDPFNTDKEQVKADTHNSEAGRDHSRVTKDRSKTAKGQPETNKGQSQTKKDNIKTDKGQHKSGKKADGNHFRGSWTKPDDTHITFEASKTSEDHVTEVKFVQSEEQFIKDADDNVLFSLNSVTRFFVTLIGGNEHDEKLDKIMEGLGAVSSKGSKKAKSRWWWW